MLNGEFMDKFLKDVFIFITSSDSIIIVFINLLLSLSVTDVLKYLFKNYRFMAKSSPRRVTYLYIGKEVETVSICNGKWAIMMSTRNDLCYDATVPRLNRPLNSFSPP